MAKDYKKQEERTKKNKIKRMERELLKNPNNEYVKKALEMLKK